VRLNAGECGTLKIARKIDPGVLSLAIKNRHTDGIVYWIRFRNLGKIFLSLLKLFFDLLNLDEELVNLFRNRFGRRPLKQYIG